MTSPLRDYRKKHGITMAALAAQVGMDEAHLSKLERGLAGVGVHKLVKLTQITGLKAEEIIQ